MVMKKHIWVITCEKKKEINMKLKIFYSWQSDLPNNKNRGFINNCLSKAAKNIYQKDKSISEYLIESDSRNESGTPDLVTSIFSKIDVCDIFVADISIINSTENQISAPFRKMPNPNVMIELGYAAKSVGWEQIICVFNREYAEIEELPFDIRFRKPIVYNTCRDKVLEKQEFTQALELQIASIIREKLTDKKYYDKTKRQADLGMQAILIDFCKIFYSDGDNIDQYNYMLLLNSTLDDLIHTIENKKYLGFQLFKNVSLNIDEFSSFFQDDVNMFFLSTQEKKIIVKMIHVLKDYKEFMILDHLCEQKSLQQKYTIVSGHKMNPNNPPASYILLEIINNEKGIVRDSGMFDEAYLNYLLNYYTIADGLQKNFCQIVINIVSLVKDWIKATGNYFIVNDRLITPK